MSREKQPIANLEWVSPSTLRANDYNPNHVAPIEFELLKQSLLEDGWTAPIVAGEDNVIVDGFHRWTLASTDPEVAGMTGGLIPVVRRRAASAADRRIATIRHNRARGKHGIAPMADIVRDLKDNHGLTDAEIQQRLGMEDEEIERLYDRAGMPKRAGKGFGKGWVPNDDENKAG